MTVRSAVLSSFVTEEGVTATIYTCPAGVTALIKDLRLSSPVGNVSRGVVFVRSGPIQVSLYDGALGTGLAELQGFVVLEPGDELGCVSIGNVMGVWASGAELAGVAP